MPIEIVCKIAFSEEEEKQRAVRECDRESLLEEEGGVGRGVGDNGSAPSALSTFADTCTLHGLSQMLGRGGGGGGGGGRGGGGGGEGGGGLRRGLWALAFLASLSLFLHQVVSSAVLYLQHQHVTALDGQSGREMAFPAITICNINRFRHHALTDADIFHLTNLTGLPPKDKAANRGYPKANMEDIFNRTGHQMREMLKNCNFSGVQCLPINFSVVYTRYGKCYTFNANKERSWKTKQGGMGNGLEIMMDIQQEEYLPIWKETDDTSFEAGIRVQIHSQEEPPYIHELGFGVPPGFQTFVSCQEQRLTYLPEPWGNCKSDLPNSEIPGYVNYSITACRLNCEKQAVLKACGCRMVHMPGNETICNPEDYLACADKTLDDLVKKSNETCQCVTPCQLTRYNKELSMVRIPSRGSAKFLAHKFNTTADYIRENYLVLDIFFEALNYETIEQKEAYSMEGLLGDIGGQMGLFIGASILTILEIIDYIYEVIRVKAQRTFQRQKPPRDGTDPIATLGLSEVQPSSREALASLPDGHPYATNLLPYHHRSPFKDFAC